MRKERIEFPRRHFKFAAKFTGMVPSSMSLQSLLLEFTQQHQWWVAVGSIYVAVYERMHWYLRVYLGRMELSSVIIEPSIV